MEASLWNCQRNSDPQEVLVHADPEDRFHSRTDQDSAQLNLVRRFTQENSPATEAAPKTLSFRLVADISVQANTTGAFLEQPDVTPQQRSFFAIVLANPEAFNRMCRLAIVSDLEAHSEEWFETEFEGPETEDILNCALPYLSADDQDYWNRIKQESGELLSYFLMPIFLEFSGSLNNVAILDLTTGETIPNRVCSRHNSGG
jgi:hypothetical protein